MRQLDRVLPGVLPLVALLVMAAADGGVAEEQPPPGLACLTRWYAGTVTRDDAGWGLRLPDGSVLPWDRPGDVRDGPGDVRDRPGDGGVALSELYAVPYVAGPIVPVDTSDAGQIEDPGRVRVEQLFRATYGGSRGEVASQMAKVRFFGPRYAFHRRAAPALERVVERLTPQVKRNRKLRPFLRDIGGTFAWRRISRSRNLSSHAFGIAIDLNVERAHYWRWTPRGEQPRWRNRFPAEIVEAFEAEGFIWGGRWVHFDTMHFEYRPELLSPACTGGGEEAAR